MAKKTLTPSLKTGTLNHSNNNELDILPSSSYTIKGKPNQLMSIALALAITTTISFFVLGILAVTYFKDLVASQKEHTTILKAIGADQPYISTFDTEMRQINPDYICWLTIGDTIIDYPVVRANDNETYLHTSFYGDENVFGTLFMDYRCEGEYVPNIIIYGHNSVHGDMFGGLRKFLDNQYLLENPIITLKANDHIVDYEVFSATKTDISDTAYSLGFNSKKDFYTFAEKRGAPPGTTQIVTLSTCVSGNDKNERVIIQGAFVSEY